MESDQLQLRPQPTANTFGTTATPHTHDSSFYRDSLHALIANYFPEPRSCPDNGAASTHGSYPQARVEVCCVPLVPLEPKGDVSDGSFFDHFPIRG